MNFIQLLTTTPVAEIVEAYNRLYPTGDPLTREFYSGHFLPLVGKKVLVNQPGCRIVLDHIVVRHDDPVDDRECYDVSMIDESGEKYSISFIPWGDALAFEVENRCHLPLTQAELCAHLYWEFTWHGLECDMEDKRDEVADRLEEALRSSENEGTGAASRMVDLSELFDACYETDEERQRANLEIKRFRANAKTARRYVNGVLKSRPQKP